MRNNRKEEFTGNETYQPGDNMRPVRPDQKLGEYKTKSWVNLLGFAIAIGSFYVLYLLTK